VEGGGFTVYGLGFRVYRSGFRVQGPGFRVQGLGFRVQVSGFRVQGAGFRVQGSGSRGSGFGVGLGRPPWRNRHHLQMPPCQGLGNRLRALRARRLQISPCHQQVTSPSSERGRHAIHPPVQHHPPVHGGRECERETTGYGPFDINSAPSIRTREIGILLPNNQRPHRTLHIQKDVLDVLP